MRKRKRRLVSGLLLLSVTLLCAGCTKGKSAEETTLYIEKNGRVTGAIVEQWDQEYYSEKELKNQIEEEITSYEADHQKSQCKLQKFEIKDGSAKVNIRYDSLADYAAFNYVTAYEGTIAQAQEDGYDFPGEFISTQNKPSITMTELDGSKTYHVWILSERQTICTGKKILYTSSNVKVSEHGRKAVIDSDSRELAYLIYK